MWPPTGDGTAPWLLSTAFTEYRWIEASPYRFVRRFMLWSSSCASSLDSIRQIGNRQHTELEHPVVLVPSSLRPHRAQRPEPQTASRPDWPNRQRRRRLTCNLWTELRKVEGLSPTSKSIKIYLYSVHISCESFHNMACEKLNRASTIYFLWSRWRWYNQDIYVP